MEIVASLNIVLLISELKTSSTASVSREMFSSDSPVSHTEMVSDNF